MKLFVIDQAALPRLSGKDRLQLSSERKRTAAAWLADNKVYLLATEGDRALLERFFGVSRKQAFVTRENFLRVLPVTPRHQHRILIRKLARRGVKCGAAIIFCRTGC